MRIADVVRRPGSPKSVECAIIDVRQIFTTLPSRNVSACSTFANRHDRRQHAMGAAFGSNMYRDASGAACSSPDTRQTSRGTDCNIQKP